MAQTHNGQRLDRTRGLSIDGRSLTHDDVVQVAREQALVTLSPAAIPGLEASLRVVQRAVEQDEVAYGVTTGFGALSDQRIPPDLVRQLQHNLIRSHAAGAGAPLPTEVIRAAMLLRANSLAFGLSGVRPVVITMLLDLLNHGIHPVVPEQGSLGASGDLAPLSHIALTLIGLGTVQIDGTPMPASDALARFGIEPLDLGPKEALALINGTQIMTALGVLAFADGVRLLHAAISVATLSAFALAAHRDAFAAELHWARPHPGQIEVATQMRQLLQDAGETPPGTRRVQDPYSIRCIPQVYGAIRDALQPFRATLEIEINAATDNPLIFAESGRIIAGGNFHGHPLALGSDSAGIALASLGTMAERRVNLLVDGQEHGLPGFLVREPGVNSGYMIAHYLTAGLVAENRVLAHPASIDSLPVSAGIEDYNSMGAISARHLRQVIANLEHIIAVEALCAAQACDLSGRIPAGPLGALHSRIRSRLPFLERDDRVIADDIDVALALLRAGSLNALAQVSPAT